MEIECLVLPPISEDGSLGLLLEYGTTKFENHYFSHKIQTNDGNEYNVRLMVKVRETEVLIDPLDFRYHNGKFFYIV